MSVAFCYREFRALPDIEVVLWFGHQNSNISDHSSIKKGDVIGKFQTRSIQVRTRLQRYSVVASTADVSPDYHNAWYRDPTAFCPKLQADFTVLFIMKNQTAFFTNLTHRQIPERSTDVHMLVTTRTRWIKPVHSSTLAKLMGLGGVRGLMGGCWTGRERGGDSHPPGALDDLGPLVTEGVVGVGFHLHEVLLRQLRVCEEVVLGEREEQREALEGGDRAAQRGSRPTTGVMTYHRGHRWRRGTTKRQKCTTQWRIPDRIGLFNKNCRVVFTERFANKK